MNDWKRYSRQITLPDFGREGQECLKASSALVIGVGGLGVPVLQYLTAAGVGHIGIIDNDVIDITNLHRQVLYTEVELGQHKAQLAKAKMAALNSQVRIEAYQVRIDAQNALKLIEPYDLVIDCTDNFPTRYLVNDACYLLGKPLVYGAIYRWEGQVSVFNLNDSPNYRDLYPNPPLPGEVPNCEEGGVLGVLPGIIGSLQANEAIKIMTGLGDVLSSKLLIFDAKRTSFQTLKYSKNGSNPLYGHPPQITSLIDYEEFCGIKNNLSDNEQITAGELRKWIESDKEFQLVDVREANEYQIENINGENIPLSTLKTEVYRIEDDIPVVLMCQTGKRSMSVLQFLKKEHDFDNLLNLDGGLREYLRSIK